MVCTYCGHKTTVTNSRRQKRSNQVWRRRLCPSCGATFTTHEAVDVIKAHTVASQTGLITPLDRDRLYTEVLLALQDRKKCYEEARELTSTILTKVLAEKADPIQTNEISKIAAGVLKRFNRRAWLRYVAEHPSLKA